MSPRYVGSPAPWIEPVVEERRSRVDGEVARERDAGPQALCRERVRSRGASEGQPGEEH